MYRHLVDRSYLKPIKSIIGLGFKLLTQHIHFNATTTPFLDIVNGYQGSKKRLYYKALVNLRETGLLRKHAYVNMFIKPDRWPEDIIQHKPPRAIQYRKPEFNLVMAHNLKDFENKFINEFKPFGLRVCAKGLNQRQRAELLVEKAARFNNPYFICIDHSKFDSTVTKEHLQHLHKIYRKVTKRKLPFLKYQIKNVCYSKHNIKYIARGTRCSGDFDTGLGNTVINAAAIMYVMKDHGYYDFIIDGDDAVIVCDRPLYSIDGFKKFGFETKLTVTQDIHKAEFCQSRVIFNNGPLFSRNPIRAISNHTVSRKRYNLKGMLRYIAGVGQAEMAVSQGVPVLQAAAERMMALSNKPIFDERQRYRMENGLPAESIEITAEARLTFSYAWDISPAMQQCMEQVPVHPLYAVCSDDIESIKNAAKSFFQSWTTMGSLGITSGPDWWAASWSCP